MSILLENINTFNSLALILHLIIHCNKQDVVTLYFRYKRPIYDTPFETVRKQLFLKDYYKE